METKVYDKNKFDELVTNVELDTAYNNHSEALMKIASFFGYDEYYYMFKMYSEIDGLTTEQFQTRCEVKDRMFYIIQAEFGIDVITRLDEVL